MKKTSLIFSLILVIGGFWLTKKQKSMYWIELNTSLIDRVIYSKSKSDVTEQR